jgi:hypothetical protein
MADIIELLLAPNSGASGADYYKQFQQNIDSLNLLTYGSKPPTGVLAHDHGQARGEVLERALLALALGPTSDTGFLGSSRLGIPMYPPIPPESFVDTPKQLLTACILVPGNTGSLKVTLSALLAPASTQRIYVEIRQLGEQGALLGVQGIAEEINFSVPPLGSGHDVASCSFTQQQLQTVCGALGLDKPIELVVWLADDPPIGTLYRLTSLTVYATSVSTQLPIQPVTLDALPIIEPLEIQSGRPIMIGTITKGAERVNAATKAAIGLVPGYNVSGEEDTSASWQRTVNLMHQHTGKSLGDGACLRNGMVHECYAFDFGVLAGQMAIVPSYGLPLVDGRGIAIELDHRLSIPEGLGSFSCRFAVLPTRSVDQYLRVSVYVYDASGTLPPIATQYATVAKCLQHTSIESSNWLQCEVEPIPDRLYKSVGDIGASGSSVWSLNSLLQAFLVPSTFSQERAYRITNPLQVFCQVPSTNTYRCRLRLELVSLADGSLDTGARLHWLSIVPDFGY